MSMIGLLGLLVAFAGCVISVLCLGVAHILYKKRSFERSETFAWGGRVAAGSRGRGAHGVLCCARVVLLLGRQHHPVRAGQPLHLHGPRAWLYKLAGLWAGLSGLALFWAWLIAVFNAVLVFATRKECAPAR